MHAGASIEINVNLLHKNMFSTLFIGVFSTLTHHTLLSENVFHIFTQHVIVACWVKVENTPNIKVEYLPTRKNFFHNQLQHVQLHYIHFRGLFGMYLVDQFIQNCTKNAI